MIRFIMGFSGAGLWVLLLIWLVHHDERVTAAAQWAALYLASTLAVTVSCSALNNLWSNWREARASKKRDDAKYEN